MNPPLEPYPTLPTYATLTGADMAGGGQRGEDSVPSPQWHQKPRWLDCSQCTVAHGQGNVGGGNASRGRVLFVGRADLDPPDGDRSCRTGIRREIEALGDPWHRTEGKSGQPLFGYLLFFHPAGEIGYSRAFTMRINKMFA